MDTTNWKWFRYDEIFDIRKGKRLTAADQEVGDIPYIGAIDSNNGVSAYIANNQHLHQGNTISVSYNGSIGQAYYQSQPFWATDDVNVFYPKFKFNRYIAFYILPLIEKEKYRFCYGRKWTSEAMKHSRMPLPTTAQGTPDWQYMEDYVKNTLIPQLPEQARAVWEGKYDTTPELHNKIRLNTDNWRLFNLNEIFNISYGNKLDRCQMEEATNGIAFVTRTATNNGVGAYVERLANITPYPAHCLSIALGGSIGSTFLQTKPFYTSQNVAVLEPKKQLSDKVLLMIAALIENECRIKFVAFGRELNKHIKNNIFIKLPTTEDDTPDWQFMEDYIKSLPYSKNI